MKIIDMLYNDTRTQHLDQIIVPLRYQYSGLFSKAIVDCQPIKAIVEGHIGYIFVEKFSQKAFPMHFQATIELDDEFPKSKINFALSHDDKYSSNAVMNQYIKQFINCNQLQPKGNEINLLDWFNQSVAPQLDELGNFLIRNNIQIE